MSDKGVNDETVTLDGNLYFLCAQCNLCKNLPRPVDYNNVKLTCPKVKNISMKIWTGKETCPDFTPIN
ncbi:MAG: hypothetical protein WCS27_11320 [Victivallaceae bacterium]|jgi:Zn finger protein HypA/HybF involved in hydrogenase expression